MKIYKKDEMKTLRSKTDEELQSMLDECNLIISSWKGKIKAGYAEGRTPMAEYYQAKKRKSRISSLLTSRFNNRNQKVYKGEES